MKNEIVDEVRKARNSYAEKFNYDLDLICEDLRRKQNSSGAKVVSFPPKLVSAQALHLVKQ